MSAGLHRACPTVAARTWATGLAAGAALLAAAADATAVAADASQPGLARPAVDVSMFRDGEVRRRNEMHGRWSLDCDEIAKLAQRFCSLRSLALDPSGVAVARITISTDDAGRPAALIDLPRGAAIGMPVKLSADHGLVLSQPSKALLKDTQKIVGAQRAKSVGRTPDGAVGTDLLSASLPVASCDDDGCHALWPLAPTDIGALRAGAGLRLRFAVVDTPVGAFPMRAALAAHIVEATLSCDGFGDAVAASVR